VSHTVYDCRSIAQRTAGLKHAARALAADACVVLPTDTVYGIGADAFSARGVATLLAAKGRSRAMPPPVLIAHAGVLDGLADEVSDDARALAAAFGVPEREAQLEEVLRRASGEAGYLFEYERHAELVRLLGLPDIAVATGYEYIEGGELPEGLEESDLRRVG